VAFVRMDVLPLTSNGKVDRRALPTPDLASISRKDTYVAPRTSTEQAFARIWSEVLGVESPGIHDNFFELGGDSILTIQVITRARKAGMAITPRDLFQTPTISELAAAELGRHAPVETDVEEGPSGEAELTPIQRWFFAQPLEQRNYWNQTFLFEVPAEIDVDRLEQALSAAIAHHDAFRLRFEKTSSGWRQSYVDEIPRLTMTRAESVPTAEEIVAQAVQAQSSLDISRGPLLAATHFPMGPGRPGRLLITAHHLVIDGVSWRLLLEDAESAYWALQDTKQPKLPPTTASYKSWSAALAAYAGRLAVQAEITYWQGVLDNTSTALPVDHSGGLNTEDSTETVTVKLTAEQTEILLRRIPAAFHSQINDVLLTALAESFRTWIGCESLLVDVEGHGREDIGDIDVSRTIGWFTSIYPVRLPLTPDARLDRSLQSVKNQLRQIPGKGLGYGLLRDRMGWSTQAQVAFNYLGQFDQVVAGSRLFSFAAESVGAWHGPKNRRTHLIEVIVRVLRGALVIDLNFSRNVHTRANVERVAALYSRALVGLMNLSSAADAQRWYVADFALTHLAEAELERISKRHAVFEDIYPLSPMQKLFHSMEDSASHLGFEQWRFVLRGAMDAAAMRQAWERVVERHPILRTAFVSDGLSETLQVVLPARRLDWTEIDLRGLGESAAQRNLEEFIVEDRAKGFDLSNGQLLRVSLLRLKNEEWQMMWSTHHLLIDGWSWPVIFNELAWFYTSRDALPKPRPYRDYIAWILARSDREGESFWREYLKNFRPAPLRIGERPSPAPGLDKNPIGEEIASLDEDVTRSLLNTARSHYLTLNTVLQGAWALVLSHHQDSSVVVFGAANSGRPAELTGIEGMVGPCVNNLPVRAKIIPEMPASTWLKQLQDEQFGASQHQCDSIDRIQFWSGIPLRFRLFDSLVVFQNYAASESTRRLSESVTLEIASAPETTNYPLTLTVVPGSEVSLKILYRRDQFQATNIHRILSDLGVVLHEIGKMPGATLCEITSRLAPPPAVLAAASPVATGRAETTPHSEMERTIAAIWQELFDSPQINLDANFFDLGGYSLLLVRAHQKLQEALGRRLPIVTLLQHPSVRALAQQLDGNGRPRLAAQDLQERARRQRQALSRIKGTRRG
jgi:non-ribosomal peptide synthase protein (TIGR01720 family)